MVDITHSCSCRFDANGKQICSCAFHKSQINIILEGCAEIARTMQSSPVYYVNGQPNAAPIVGGKYIADAILALKDKL